MHNCVESHFARIRARFAQIRFGVKLGSVTPVNNDLFWCLFNNPDIGILVDAIIPQVGVVWLACDNFIDIMTRALAFHIQVLLIGL